MKTTIEIPDPIMKEAKALARREGITVRALVERGLQLALAERKTRRTFALRDLSVAGSGLQPDAAGRSCDELRALTYEGRGD
jgi:non-ribosomal peptide synthetase component E (peptide arylation enzyme)